MTVIILLYNLGARHSQKKKFFELDINKRLHEANSKFRKIKSDLFI